MLNTLACKQLKLALVHTHRHTKSDCETTAIEINRTPTKCELFYVANHKIMIASFGFSAKCYSINVESHIKLILNINTLLI